MGKHQGPEGSLRGIAQRQPALPLLLDSRPALGGNQPVQQLPHLGVEDGLDALAFEQDPVLIEPGQQLTLVDRQAGCQGIEVGILSLQVGNIQPVV